MTDFDDFDPDDEADTPGGFPFGEYSETLVQSLVCLVRRIAGTANVEPADLAKLGALWEALEALPRPTPGVSVYLEIPLSKVDRHEPSASSVLSVQVTEDELIVEQGGMAYDPAIGGDSYTDFRYEAYAGGYEELQGLEHLGDLAAAIQEVLRLDLADFDLTIEGSE